MSSLVWKIVSGHPGFDDVTVITGDDGRFVAASPRACPTAKGVALHRLYASKSTTFDTAQVAMRGRARRLLLVTGIEVGGLPYCIDSSKPAQLKPLIDLSITPLR